LQSLVMLDSLRYFGIVVGEVLQDDQGFIEAVVLDHDAFFGRLFGNKELVAGGLAEAEHDGRFALVDTELAKALHYQGRVASLVHKPSRLRPVRR
jgi:hypothetical protein